MDGETIARDAAYSKTEFLRRIGRKQASWSSLKRAGLRTIIVAGGSYVLGSDWLRFLADRSSVEASAEPSDEVDLLRKLSRALKSGSHDEAKMHLEALRKAGINLRLGSDLDQNEVAE